MRLRGSALSPGLGPQAALPPRGRALLRSTSGWRSVGPVKRRGFSCGVGYRARGPAHLTSASGFSTGKTDTGQIQYLLPTDVYVEGWKRTSLDPSLLGFGAFITFPASFCRAAPSVARVAGSSAAVVGGPGLGGLLDALGLQLSTALRSLPPSLPLDRTREPPHVCKRVLTPPGVTVHHSGRESCLVGQTKR